MSNCNLTEKLKIPQTGQSRKGYWSMDEQKEFNVLLKLFRDKKITKKKLLQGIKTRTPKQVWSHYNKLKYYFKNKYDNNQGRDDFYLNLIETLQKEEAERELERENYFEFCDEMTSSKLRISTSVLEYLISHMSVKNSFEMVTLKIDENIIKTIVKKKMFYDEIKRQIEKNDKPNSINANSDTLKDSSPSVTEKSTKQTEKSHNDYWTYLYDDYCSSGAESPKPKQCTIFEFKNDTLSRKNSKSKHEEISFKELTRIDHNFRDDSYFTEEDFTEESEKQMMIDEENDNISLDEKMKKLLDKEGFISPEPFDV